MKTHMHYSISLIYQTKRIVWIFNIFPCRRGNYQLLSSNSQRREHTFTTAARISSGIEDELVETCEEQNPKYKLCGRSEQAGLVCTQLFI